MNSHSKVPGTLKIVMFFAAGLLACSQQVDADGSANSEEALSAQTKLAPSAKAALEDVGIASLTQAQLKKLDTDKSKTVSFEEGSVWLDAIGSSKCSTPACNCGGGSGGSGGSVGGGSDPGSSGGGACDD